jgi:hypothetical protein
MFCATKIDSEGSGMERSLDPRVASSEVTRGRNPSAALTPPLPLSLPCRCKRQPSGKPGRPPRKVAASPSLLHPWRWGARNLRRRLHAESATSTWRRATVVGACNRLCGQRGGGRRGARWGCRPDGPPPPDLKRFLLHVLLVLLPGPGVALVGGRCGWWQDSVPGETLGRRRRPWCRWRRGCSFMAMLRYIPPSLSRLSRVKTQKLWLGRRRRSSVVPFLEAPPRDSGVGGWVPVVAEEGGDLWSIKSTVGGASGRVMLTIYHLLAESCVSLCLCILFSLPLPPHIISHKILLHILIKLNITCAFVLDWCSNQPFQMSKLMKRARIYIITI